MQESAIKNQRHTTNETNVGRREFIKTAGLGAIALGAGFGASRTFAQEASSSTYKPVTSNYMQVHKDLVVIDGCTNLTGLDKNVDYLNWYKQGGAKALERLNEAKIIVDVSHTGTQSGLEAVETSKSPVVLSHSNSRNYRASPRNAPDELITAVAKSGGLVGSLMYAPFIAETAFPTMDDYVGNIDYLVQLVGIDHVAICSDYTYQISMSEAEQKAGWKMMIDSGAWNTEAYPYDVTSFPKGLETPKTLFNLTDALLGRGYKKEDIAKLWGGNWLRVMRAVIG